MKAKTAKTYYTIDTWDELKAKYSSFNNEDYFHNEEIYIKEIDTYIPIEYKNLGEVIQVKGLSSERFIFAVPADTSNSDCAMSIPKICIKGPADMSLYPELSL